MKFTILPDFEYKRKKRELRKKKRAERRVAQQNRINYRYLKRKKFWMVWLERFIVVFLIIGMGGTWYFKLVLQDANDNAENIINEQQDLMQRYLERRYGELTGWGEKPGKNLDEQLGAYMYRFIPIREYGGYDGISAVAAAIYNEDGEMIIDSSPRYYLFCDRYEQVGEEEKQKTNLYESYYTCAQELPYEFIRDYNEYYIYSNYEIGKMMEFGDFYVDEGSRQFYFSTVSCYEHGEVVKSYNFTPEDVDGMEKIQETPERWERKGTKWYPVLGTKSSEISELLQVENNVYNKYKNDKQLKGAGITTERGYFSKTDVNYSVIQIRNQMDDSYVEYTIVTAYKYDFFQKYRSFTLKLVSSLLLAILIISSLWARFTYVRLKARYELEDYQRSLTNAMAHDLKSPLMILSGMAENLKENVHTEKREYYADEMLKNIADMNRMIEQSLGFSKLSQTGRIDRKTEVDMRAQTENLVRKYKELSEAHEQRISVTGEGTMHGNEAMLRQLADNLLQNAILHGEGGGQIEITVGKGTYQIQNTYTGLLTTEGAKKLLKPYTKEENRKRTGGHGLGLSIVNEIVKLHGGKIHLKVADDTFEVSVKI